MARFIQESLFLRFIVHFTRHFSKSISILFISKPQTVSVIGAPMTFGQPYSGTDRGPQLLRDAGLLENLASIGWRVADKGDLDFSAIGDSIIKDGYIPSHKAKNSQIVGAGCKLLSDTVIEAVHENTFPLILGGDHSIGTGSVSGLLKSRPNTGIIWVDAHADLNIPDMSESGNMHGMPVGLLMKGIGFDASTIPGFEWLGSPDMIDARISPDSIVYIGLRDVDAFEREKLRELKIKAFTMYDVDKYGIGQVMEMTLNHLLAKDPNRPIHLSYDIDACDPAFAPATGTAVRGGLTYREAHFIAEATARSGQLASAEIVEFNPMLSDGDGMEDTLNLSAGLITSIMGKSII